MFGACFYTEHAKPRNVCFQRHFAKVGLYIVPTHVILVSNNRSTENNGLRRQIWSYQVS